MKNFLIKLFVNKPAWAIVSLPLHSWSIYYLQHSLFVPLMRQLITEDVTTNRSTVIMSCHSRPSLPSISSRPKSSGLESNSPGLKFQPSTQFPKCVALKYYLEALSFSFCICKMGLMLLSLHVFRMNNTTDVKPLDECSAHTTSG